MSRSKKRRSWSAAEKLRIVLSGLETGREVSELCRKEGISATQYYTWKKQLLGNAEAVFGDRRIANGEARRQERHEQEVTRLRAVIAEITAENLELKKTL